MARKGPDYTCSIEGCGSAGFARGWCQKHYVRWHRHGDPLAILLSEAGTLAEQRFWSRVKKTETCWLWQGKPQAGGYGQIRLDDGRIEWVHRYAYEIQNGPLPEGMNACHHCDNPPCVRGDHLFPGTDLDNMRDAIKKGRHWWQDPERHSRRMENFALSIQRRHEQKGGMGL